LLNNRAEVGNEAQKFIDKNWKWKKKEPETRGKARERRIMKLNEN
jgi:hypothetical protein